MELTQDFLPYKQQLQLSLQNVSLHAGFAPVSAFELDLSPDDLALGVLGYGTPVNLSGHGLCGSQIFPRTGLLSLFRISSFLRSSLLFKLTLSPTDTSVYPIFITRGEISESLPDQNPAMDSETHVLRSSLLVVKTPSWWVLSPQMAISLLPFLITYYSS